ncbi:MAG: BspA family leucine-rich repeat surface protein [Lachnospiraceae bacterium]|nr:BspA family leucine-rich repeat surface protein [Lachnospiraceae bacterium]
MSGVDLSNVSHVNEMFWDTDINVIYTPLNVLKDIDLSGEYFDAITGEDYKSLPQKKDETIKLLRKGIYDKPTPVPVPEDDLKWPTPKSDWYTDYDYLLEGNNIYLNSSKGTLPETVVIPATAVIDGVTYNVVLNSTDPNYSLWYPDVENIKKIRLCKGVGVKDGNAKNLFFCLNNTEVIDISEFDTSTITDMSGMFGYCMKVQDLDLSKFDTSNVTDMNSMFCGCHCLRSLDLSSFNTSRVTDMGNMFTSCATLTSLNISSFDTSNVTRMNVMFGSCQKLKKIDVSSFDTSKVTCMNYMFSECDELTSLDLRNFDTTNVTGMLSMFFSDQKLVNLDISGFNTSNVTDMDSMFAFCKGLRNIDISGFDTSKVTVMQGMFRECTGLTKLDVSGFDTSNVTNLGYMFYGCTGLRSIDVSNFNTSKVTYMSYMFKGCSNLVSLDIRKFIIDEKCKTSEMLFNSGSIRMLPVEWIKGYNHKTIGGNKNDSILKKIYYAGTKEQWETLENVVSDDVEILFEQTGEIIIPVDPIPVTGITIEQGKNYRLVIGEKVTLIALYTPDDATQYTEVTWESDNENVATVDPQSGTVTAVAIGKVKITATTANNKTASCIIKIYDPNVAEELSAMNSAVLIDENTSEIHLVKGQKFTLPETGWDCSDKKILKISKKGVLTAKKDKITPVKLTKGEQSIDVYVSKPSYLSKSITLDAGKTQDIGFSYDKDNLPVAWYSNAPDVATISENGEVKAVAKGTATITAYVNGAAYTCKVKVKEPDATLERTLHLALKTSKSIKISGVKKLVWTADDPSLVEIKGSKIKGLATGETILRAKNGDKEYVIHLYVEDATIITEGIIASGKNKYSVVLQAGENIPIGFKYVDQDVVFKSNNGEVAYFDEGVIVANKSGKAKLNAKVNGKSVVLSVLVK